METETQHKKAHELKNKQAPVPGYPPRGTRKGRGNREVPKGGYKHAGNLQDKYEGTMYNFQSRCRRGGQSLDKSGDRE